MPWMNEPTLKVVLAVNPPVPFPRRIVALVLLAAAISSFPSALKSPIARKAGVAVTANSRAAWNVPFPLPRNTLTSAVPSLAVIASSLPSPFTSRSTTVWPFVPPRLYVTAGLNVPSPFPIHTFRFTSSNDTMSALPSPFKSPAAIE